MHIVVVGIDHTTAPIAAREQLTCSPSQIPQILEAAHPFVQESVLLSTCNRLEWYAICPQISKGQTDLLRLLSETRQVKLAQLQVHCYTYADEEAVGHLFGVTSGLYSQMLGEAQIQGKVARALELAQESHCAGPITSALFRAALATGKRARSETAIWRHAASVSQVAVPVVRQHVPKLNEASILLIGSGQMGELAARTLHDTDAGRLIIMNRTHAHAIDLAQRLGATPRAWMELTDALAEADVVISATAAQEAILTFDLLQQVMRQRAGCFLLLIDLALPRDIDPAVVRLPDVRLYNLDDLQASAQAGLYLRMQEVERVQAIIATEACAFDHWLRSLSVSDAICALRQHAESLRQQELKRTLQQLASSLSEQEVAAITALSTRLVNKLLHTPTVRLKEATATDQAQVYAQALRYLFALGKTLGQDERLDRGNGEAGL